MLVNRMQPPEPVPPAFSAPAAASLSQGPTAEPVAENSPVRAKKEKKTRRTDGAVWVDGYTRRDGTQVRGHWRAAPERK